MYFRDIKPELYVTEVFKTRQNEYFRDIETANNVTKAVSKMQSQRSNDSKTIELEFQHSREFHLTSSIERRQGELT